MTDARSFRRIAILVAALLLAAACGGADDAEAPAAEDTAADTDEETTEPAPEETAPDATEEAAEALSVDLGISVPAPDADLFPYIAADALGYFDEENLTVNVIPTGGSGDLIEQIVAGNIDVGTPNMLTLVNAMGTGDLGLANYYTMAYGTNFGVFVKSDSPLQSIEELAGLNIGVTEPGGGEFAVLVAALGDAGLTLDDVTTIPIGAGDAATFNAIDTGQVDAYAAALQDVFALQVAGMDIREITPDLFGTNPQRGLITTPEIVASEGEALTRLARAWAKATLFCQTNPEPCGEFQSQVNTESWAENEAGLSIGGLQYEDSLPNLMVPDDEMFGRHYLDSYDELVAEFERTVEGFEPFSIEEFLTDELLEEINDFDREAVVAEAEGFSG